MKRSLCLLAMGAPFLLGAALPLERPIPRAPAADVVNVNFLTRLLEGNGGSRHSSSPRRTRPAQKQEPAPTPPDLADVPIPQPKPMEAAQAIKPADDDNAGRKSAENSPNSGSSATANKSVDERKPDAPLPAPVEPSRDARTQAPEAPKTEEPVKENAQAPSATPSEQQANPPAIAEVPVPLPKPEEKGAGEPPKTDVTDTGPKPDGKEKEEENAAAPPPPPPPPLVKENPEELKACIAELQTLGAKFEPTDPINDGNGCGIENPLEINEVLPGVNLGGAVMRCKTAVTMAHWLKDTVQPALNIAMPGRRIVGVLPGSTYACRLRNSAATGKISEHARGNGYDVAAFKLDNGEKMEMKQRVEDSTLEGAFQRTATAGACLHFTTVLSPGSDAAHETHLHLDVMERKGGYRYCR